MKGEEGSRPKTMPLRYSEIPENKKGRVAQDQYGRKERKDQGQRPAQIQVLNMKEGNSIKRLI
jgi:hypothetical protein